MAGNNVSVPCIVCEKPLEDVSGVSENQPYNGLTCHAEGQYGCTEFDPMDGSYLEFNVCDECLVKKASAGIILIGRTIYENDQVVGFEKPKVWRGPKQYRYHIETDGMN